MDKTPAYAKVISIIGVLVGIIGLIMAFKVPGNFALVPLFIGLLFGFVAFLIAKKLKTKCMGSYLAIALSTIGIIITLTFQMTKESTKSVDVQFDKKTEQTNDEITEGDELDNALDELE